MHIRGPKAFFAGIIFIALALLFGTSAASLNMGNAARMGPGYFPMAMSIVLALFGVVEIADGLVRHGNKPDGTSVRAIVMVAGAVLAFALSIRALGLIPAIALTSFLFSMADRDFKILPSAVAALVLALAAWVIFIFALKLPWQAFGTLFN